MLEVYKITNKCNSKAYVGITCQGHMVRFRHHVFESKHGSTCPIHRAIEKYGEESFLVEVIDNANTIAELKEKEIYWISKLNSDGMTLYNLTDGGDGTFGYKHSDETKKKLSIIASGRTHSEEHKLYMSVTMKNIWKTKSKDSIISRNKSNTKSVYLYNNEMKLMHKFDSVKSASEFIGILPSTLSMFISKNKSTRGFIPKKELIMDVE